MRERSLVPLAAVAVLAVGLAVAVVVPRAPQPAGAAPGFGGGAVAPGQPRTAAWRQVADLVPGLDPTSDNTCERGDPSCLDAVLAEMEERLDGLGCAHTAPFAFTYLEMTKGVDRRVRDPGFFAEPEATTQLDALFARLYFEAFDNWAAGRADEVAPAWRVAFGAAASGRTGAATDLLLGMNAHISRDLAFTVAAIVAIDPSLADDPGDFHRINEVIAEVKGPMLDASARRYDPLLAALNLPLPAIAAGDAAELIARWRDRAFVQGVRLATAEPGQRGAVAAEIERESLAIAVLILNADATGLAPSTDRDAYCADRVGP